MEPGQLSHSWKPAEIHDSLYTGGKVHWSGRRNRFYCLCDEKVVIFNEQSKILHTIGTDDGAFCFAVDDRKADRVHVFTSHRSMLMRHWVIINDEKIEEIKNWRAHDQLVSDMSIDATGTLLATGSVDNSVKVWDINGHFCTHNLRGHKNVVSHVMFHPAKLQLVSVSEDFEIRVWDLKTSKLIASLRDHFSRISSIAIHKVEDEYVLISGCRDQIVNIWDLGTHKLRKSLAAFESVEGVACMNTQPFKGTGNAWAEATPYIVLTVGEKGVLRAWDPLTGRCVVEKKGTHAVQGLMRKVIPLDTKRLVTVGEDTNLVVWDLPSFTSGKHIVGHNDDVLQVMYVPGSERQRFVVVTNDENPRLVERATMESTVLYGHGSTVLGCDISFDGKWIATGSRDAEIKVWSTETTKCVVTITGHTGPVSALGFFKKQTSELNLVTGSHDKTMKVWALPLNKLNAGEHVSLNHSAFSRAAHEKDINCVLVAPNNKIIATGGADKLAKIWSIDGTLMGTLTGHRRGIWNLAFSPIDRVAATASGDATLKLWNLRDYSCIKTFEGHAQAVHKVMFLPNGMQLMSAAGDGLLKLWNIRTSDTVITLEEHEDKVWSFDLEGTNMISGSTDSKIIEWVDNTAEVDAEKQKEEAENVVRDSRIGILLSNGKIKEALTMALELDRPNQVRTIIENNVSDRIAEKIAKEVDGVDGEAAPVFDLSQWVKRLSERNLQRLLEKVVTWITNGKTSHFANMLLFEVLRHHKPEALYKIEGLNVLVNTCLEYLARHQSRAEGLLQKTFLLDLLLQSSLHHLPENKAKDPVAMSKEALDNTMHVLMDADSDEEPEAKKQRVA